MRGSQSVVCVQLEAPGIYAVHIQGLVSLLWEIWDTLTEVRQLQKGALTGKVLVADLKIY